MVVAARAVDNRPPMRSSSHVPAAPPRRRTITYAYVHASPLDPLMKRFVLNAQRLRALASHPLIPTLHGASCESIGAVARDRHVTAVIAVMPVRVAPSGTITTDALLELERNDQRALGLEPLGRLQPLSRLLVDLEVAADLQIARSESGLAEVRLENAAMNELGKKAYRFVEDPAQADFVVAFTLGAREKLSVTSTPGPDGLAPFVWSAPYYRDIDVHQFTEGGFASTCSTSRRAGMTRTSRATPTQTQR